MFAIIASIIGSGALATLVANWANRRKTRAETDNIVVKTASELVAMQNTKIATLDAQVQSLARRVTIAEEQLSKERLETARLRRWIKALRDQIRALGVEPVPEPAE